MPLLTEAGTLWQLRAAPEAAWQALVQATRLPDLTCRLLAARGISDAAGARNFLEADQAELHPPMLMAGMAAAVQRLRQACERREKVTVFGDYDVDGVTSTVLLMKLFGLLGLPCDYYLPDRIREGYGPNAAAFAEIRRRGSALIVTVDCGISSVQEAQAARDLGLDLIITDHHVPGPRLPEALAVLNPKTSPDYPYDMLAGVGVAFKLAQALLESLEHPQRAEFLDHMLELVALGTVCDVAPLDGENRSLVSLGVRRLRQGRWLGLRALGAAAKVQARNIDAGALGFLLGPRLNAGGRIGDASLGVRLLLTKDSDEARTLALDLDKANRERQKIEKEVLAEAMLQAEEQVALGAKALVLWSDRWHPGVVGLAASRLLENFGRPVMVGAVQNGLAKFSGRSRRPFHLVEALQACSALISKFGGHEVAAGASIEEPHLAAFKNAFLGQAEGLGEADFAPRLNIDLEVNLAEMTQSAYGQLAALEPFGMKNPRPVFAARACRLLPGTRAVGSDGAHLKLELRQGDRVMSGIAFRQGERLAALGGIGAEVDLAFHLGLNDFNGQRTLQVEVRDLKPSGA